MPMNDPVGDMITRIRNAQMRNKPKVSSPGSKLRERWRRLFSRVPALEREEVNILRGLLKSLLKK